MNPLERVVLSVAYFGWFALVLLTLLPWMALVSLLRGRSDPHHLAAGRWFRRAGALLARANPAWSFDVEGAMPRDGRAYLVVANHRSALDIFGLCLLCRNGWEMKWLVKSELFHLPWFAALLRLAGDVPVVRDDFDSRAAAERRVAELLDAGVPLMIFPEGTRSRDGAMGAFHPATFRLAAARGLPILPIALRGDEGYARGRVGIWPARARIQVLEVVETAGRGASEFSALASEVQDRIALALHSPIVGSEPALRKLDRATIERALASGKNLLVQGAMGVMASDGLPGKVARVSSRRFVPVGTISGVVKSVSMLASQIERCGKEAPRGFVGVNVMAAINHDDFEALSKASLSVGVSFIVQGAGISREIIRWCREAHTPFGGIVSSVRLAQLYEKWGADFLVAEGKEAGGHLGDPDVDTDRLLSELRGETSLPVIAAGGLATGADIGHALAAGAAGVQLATRFIVSKDAEVHPHFKLMHMGRTDADVVTIVSTVKGMKARALRNAFTERLAAGEHITPRGKRDYFGPLGYRGRRKGCIDCLAAGCCTSRESGHKESFCITDALMAAVVDGDMERGLFYTGQSVTRIPERTLAELRSVDELVAQLEEELRVFERTAPLPALGLEPRQTGLSA